jgi:hypothetical protein
MSTQREIDYSFRRYPYWESIARHLGSVSSKRNGVTRDETPTSIIIVSGWVTDTKKRNSH